MYEYEYVFYGPSGDFIIIAPRTVQVVATLPQISSISYSYSTDDRRFGSRFDRQLFDTVKDYCWFDVNSS